MPPKRAAAHRRNYAEEESNSDSEREESSESVVPTKRQRTNKLGSWGEHDSLLVFTHKDLKPSKLIASFDFDDTLVKTKSGKTFPTSSSDWQFWDDKVNTKLHELHKDGYKLIVFTNQNGIGKGKIAASEFQLRMEGFLEALALPVQVFAATQEDHFRKPAIGMWHYMLEHGNGGVADVDLKRSFYCGDAAGRAKEWKTKAKRDHSCGDRKFALNVGCGFHTPDEYFLGEAVCQQFDLGFDPRKWLSSLEGKPMLKTEELIRGGQELVVVAGFPASGKSSLSKKHFVSNGYVHVNRDTLHTAARCKKVADEALAAGKSVIVDNTNPDRASRAQYVELAKKYKVPSRCIVVTTGEPLSRHLNMLREVISEGENKHVPGVAYNLYKKRREEVTMGEGFSEISHVEVIPDLSDEKLKKLLGQYTDG